MRQFLKDIILCLILWVIGIVIYFILNKSEIETTKDYSFVWTILTVTSAVIVVPLLKKLYDILKKNN
jgi:hypothetical protein